MSERGECRKFCRGGTFHSPYFSFPFKELASRCSGCIALLTAANRLFQWELENLERAMRIISEQINDEASDTLSADPSALVVGGSQPSDRFRTTGLVLSSERMSRRDVADMSAASSEISSNAGSMAARRRLRRESRSRGPEGALTDPLVQTMADGTTASFQISSSSSSAVSRASSVASSSSLNYRRQSSFRGCPPSNTDESWKQSSKAGSTGSWSRGSVSPDGLRRASQCVPVPLSRNFSEDSNRDGNLSSNSFGSGSSFGDLEIANPRPTVNARKSRGLD